MAARRRVLLALLLLALLACGLVPALRGRATDLTVYRRAAAALSEHRDPWLGAEPPYVYPPLLAAALVPFGRLPALPVAITWTALSALAIVLAAARLPSTAAPLLALFFAPLWANQWNGQTNGFLLLALVLARERFARDEDVAGGALWGLSLALKPVALPVAVGLLVTSRLRALVAGAIVAAASFLVVVPFTGWRGVGVAARHVWEILRKSWPESWPANIALSGTLDRIFRPGPGTARHIAVAAGLFAIATLALLARRRRAGGAATLDLFLATTLLATGTSWLHHATVLLPLAAAAPAAGAGATALFVAAAAWHLAAQLWPAHGATLAAACGTAGLALLWATALRRMWLVESREAPSLGYDLGMSVDPELLEILACPACDERPPVTLCRLKEDVARTLVEKYRERMRDEEPVVSEGLACGKCGRVYAIVSDIPIMLVEDALPADARLP